MTRRVKDAGSSQNEMLFMRGNAMSGAPIISGTIQFPKPPIIAGMTMKKIMMRPCAVVKTLNYARSWKNCSPGYISSSRIPMESTPPTMPAHQRKHQVHRADVLVIGGVDETPPSVRELVVASSWSVVAVAMVQVLEIARAACACSPRRRQNQFGSDASPRCWSAPFPSRAYFFFASSTQVVKACSLTTRTAIGMKA